MLKTLDMHTQQEEILARIVSAEEKVQARLRKVSRLLNEAKIPYAILGGQAVAAWVATKDESMVRSTRDVDVLVRPEDLDRIKAVLEENGFIYRHVAETDIFLDGPEAKAGDGVHLIFSGRLVRPDHALPAPDVEDAGIGATFSVLPLQALVQTKLISWHCTDRMHLYDLIGVGLVDDSWPAKFAEPLRSRLQELLDNPE